MSPPPFSNEPLPVWLRILIPVVGVPVACHLAIHQWPTLALDDSWFGKAFYAFAYAEAWARLHPRLAAWLVGGGLLGGLLGGRHLYKKWLLHRSNRFIRRVSGLDDELKDLEFPQSEYDILPWLTKRPPGCTFVGLTPTRRLLPPWGTRFKPVYLSEEERSMHRHVLGKTGSGKTTSILWPQVFQDAYDGKGSLVIDAKGSDENAKMMRSIARAAGREPDLRLFSLPAWNRPRLFSHTYNMVYVAPGIAEEPGGDVVAMAERVFSVFGLGDSRYYADQQLVAFKRMCRLQHRMIGRRGISLPFTLQDIAICLRGIGAPPKSAWALALTRVLAKSLDRDAAEELSAQIVSLGKEAGPCLSGLLGAIDRVSSPLVNAPEPDLKFEDALGRNQIVYVQAPSNLYKLQAPALVKVMLMDLQQEASLRQVYRDERNQAPFSVVIDEFGSFADESFVDSLNKLRDANIQFTISHQSMADLELVGKEFAQAVLDNTRTRDVLALDNPELCERMARSLGTRPRLENTVQQGPDSVSTVTATGMLSTRAVEAYRLHPNRLKTLAARGQGFLFATRAAGTVAIPIVYAPMPQFVPNWTEELRRIDQSKAAGLKLYEEFVKVKPGLKLEVVRPDPVPPAVVKPAEEEAEEEEADEQEVERDDVPSVG